MRKREVDPPAGRPGGSEIEKLAGTSILSTTTEHGNPPAPPAIPKLALTFREACTALGIGRRKLWELTNRRLIPHVRCGTRILFPIATTEEWLRDQARRGVQR